MKGFVIWVDCIDEKYKVKSSNRRYKLPFGAEEITTVDECDLQIMMDDIRDKLRKGWTPEMCRQACEVE